MLLRSLLNLLMLQSHRAGIDNGEKPAMVGSWARKMAPELHHCPRRQGHLSERPSHEIKPPGLTHKQPLP
jgi:hypothetical protein